MVDLIMNTKNNRANIDDFIERKLFAKKIDCDENSMRELF
jgi:hypothetical protein